MKPKSYREQDGCWNCAKVYVFYEWDEQDAYACCNGAPPEPPRPPLSRIPAELVALLPEMKAKHEKWLSKRGRVEPYGKCDDWEKDAK